MTSAWFLGAAQGVPQDETAARSTIAPIRDDPQDAEQSRPPDFNEVDTDSSGELTGLARRLAGSDTIDTEKYRPWWTGLADDNHNKIVDEQVASSGTAAARETAGEQGHGTMQYADGIEPTIRDGAAYGNDYFVSNGMGANEAGGVYMTPVDTDNWATTLQSRAAEDASRRAFQGTQIQSWFTQN